MLEDEPRRAGEAVAVTLPDSVATALAEARSAGLDRLDAQLLLAHVLEQPRSWLLAHAEARLDHAQAEAVRSLVARRATGEPLAYLIGAKAFHAIVLGVGPDVLVPRPDTEVLVDWAIDLLAARPTARVIDLGTGSGAIALAVMHARPAVRMLATDLSADALRIARANAERLDLAVEFRQGAWWQAAGTDRFELILSNPPYIAAGDPHLAALRHEPRLALTPGGDGLGALREIVSGARAHLIPGGWLLLEHGHDQADPVQALLALHGLESVQTRLDLGGRPRCTGARMPIPAA